MEAVMLLQGFTAQFGHHAGASDIAQPIAVQAVD
jgi:hypothetical protein